MLATKELFGLVICFKFKMITMNILKNNFAHAILQDDVLAYTSILIEYTVIMCIWLQSDTTLGLYMYCLLIHKICYS